MKSASQKISMGRGIRHGSRLFRKSPENVIVFGTFIIPPRRYVESDSYEPASFFYPDYYCRPRSSTGSCASTRLRQSALVGYTTDREFTARKCHVTLPRRFLFDCRNYTPRSTNCIIPWHRPWFAWQTRQVCAYEDSVSQFALTMQSTGQTVTHLGES